jgi:hypothetical protein
LSSVEHNARFLPRHFVLGAQNAQGLRHLTAHLSETLFFACHCVSIQSLTLTGKQNIEQDEGTVLVVAIGDDAIG